jgi:hypothetical protein
LSIDNNYNLKASIEYKFLVKKEKLTYVWCNHQI